MKDKVKELKEMVGTALNIEECKEFVDSVVQQERERIIRYINGNDIPYPSCQAEYLVNENCENIIKAINQEEL